MRIKELQDIKSDVLRLKEELKRLKQELLYARIQELRQAAHWISELPANRIYLPSA